MNETPPSWLDWGLHLDGRGAPFANLSNVVTIMASDPALTNLVWYDEFLQRLMTRNHPREWTDADDLELAMHIQAKVGLPKVGREVVAQAVIAVAHRNARNCVCDWFNSLEHDGTARIDQFFADCLGADESEYTKAASRNFWLSMVARAYSPGCKVDNMVVLEGSQGVGKSTALQTIGGQWFAEQHESATNPKGFAEILQGKLLIEISEMDSFNRSEVNRVKQTVSCPTDRYRPSYGHHATDHPRQCIFVGTTNRDDWNRDETGARRFWPISCRGLIDVDQVQENRSQLFAEAVARHKAGEAHWLMPEEETKGEQEARYHADPWQEKIEHIVKGASSITTADIAEQLSIPLERRNRATEMRIGAALRFMGWSRQRRHGRAGRFYLYVSPEEAKWGR